MRILVTGSSGFIGTHMIDCLSRAGHEPVGLDVNGNPEFRCDLTDLKAFSDAIKKARPEALIHLAGALSQNVSAGLEFNVTSAENVLRGIAEGAEGAESDKPIKTVLVGSSAMYGMTKARERLPVVETDPFFPVTLYGRSKASTDFMGQKAFVEKRLPVFRARPFNVIGPGQSPTLFCPGVAERLAQIKQGKRKPVLEIRHWESFRDFVDVRDVCSGILAILEKGRAGEAYNICSGRATELKEVVETLIEIASVDVKIELSGEKPGPGDIPYQCGSYAKLKAESGWEPKIILRYSLTDVFKDFMSNRREK